MNAPPKLSGKSLTRAKSPAPSPESAPATAMPLERGLGQREREVMSVLWERGSANVQEVSDRLSASLAYTTVMTTLDRLFKKGLLQREKTARAFVYSTALTERDLESQRAASLVHRFFSDSGERPEILVSCLVDAVQHYDTNLLDQLEAKISHARARHAALKSDEKES